MGGCNACLASLVSGESCSAEPNRRRHASLEYFVHELTIDRQMESSRSKFTSDLKLKFVSRHRIWLP